MFGLKRKRQPGRPERDGKQQASREQAATAEPAPVTYAEMRKTANAMLVILKRWFDAVGMHDIRKHTELARDRAQILKVLSEVKDRMGGPEQPAWIPGGAPEPRSAKTAAPAKEPDEEQPGPDIWKALCLSVNQYDEFLGKLRALAESCPQKCFASTFADETISGIECMRADVVSLLRTNDFDLIDYVEHFDPARHVPIAAC